MDVVARSLREFGVEPVPAENPFWADNGGVLFPDPDWWRVALMPRPVY